MSSAQRYMMTVVFYVAGTLIGGACIEPYTPILDKTNSSILVVNGFLDAGAGTCDIQLGRTADLNSTSTSVVADAQVFVLRNDGTSLHLNNKGDGKYSVSGIPVDQNKKYYLRIRESSGQVSESDQVPVKKTPLIDSVTWEGDNFYQGVKIYVNTHDPSDATRYYLWDFEETWKYVTPYQSSVEYAGTQIVARNVDISTCYAFAPGTTIITGSSERLNKDVIHKGLITFIPQTSVKLRIRYSILVRQYALTKEAYQYWQSLRKNTENLGTLFAPIPSQTTGNIHNLTNVNQPVIGYFSAFSVTEKRIFIDRDQLPPVVRQTGYESCMADTLRVQSLPQPADIPKFVKTSVLVYPIFNGRALIGYLRTDYSCADCRLKGGSLTKPNFWF